MTLEELGQLVGVGKSTVRKWETGAIANMRRDKIAKLADALGTTVMDIMGMDKELSPAPAPIALSPDESPLLEDYRGLTPPGREYIRQTMAMAVRTYSAGDDALPQLEDAE